MPINSRDKGARFERTLSSRLNEYGFKCSRSAQHCGKTGDAPDVIGLPFIHIEAKHYKNKAFDYDWMAQAKRDCKPSILPAVFHKTDNHEILVTMELDDWMEIYREFLASMELSGRKDNG